MKYKIISFGIVLLILIVMYALFSGDSSSESFEETPVEFVE